MADTTEVKKSFTKHHFIARANDNKPDKNSNPIHNNNSDCLKLERTLKCTAYSRHAP